MGTNIEIQNVQAIERLTIQLRPGGGVTELRGNQGVGKTTALNAVRRLMGNESVKLEPRDGKKRGTIDCGTAHIAISSRTTASGECKIDSLEGRFDISTLIDPQIANPERADAARIKSLIQLRGVKGNADLFLKLFKSRDQMETYVSAETLKRADLVEMAAGIKRDLDKAARDEESKAEIDTGHAQANNEIAKSVDLDAPSDERELQRAHEEAIRRRQDYETRVRAATDDRTRREAAAERLRAAQESVQGDTVERAQEALMAAIDSLNVTIKELGELDQQRAVLQERRQSQTNTVRTFQASLERVKAYHATIAECEEIAKEGVAMPDQEEGNAAARAVYHAAEAVQLGVKVRAAQRAEELAGSYELTAAEHKRQATLLRDAGKSTEDILSDVVSGGTLRVVGGRLVVKTERDDEEAFAELSEGQRAKIAIDQAVSVVGEFGLVIISQTVWGELSYSTRQMIHEYACEHRVNILTALATEGELRAEEFVDAD